MVGRSAGVGSRIASVTEEGIMGKKLGRYGPVFWSNKSILGAKRYGLMWAHGKDGCTTVRKVDVSWRTISGVAVNTPWGAVWIYVRNWRQTNGW